ncbi:hypothetical protein NPIL_46841 [Nephila pilipes]|uniref:Uncharacterized protein n=1 Tax=Nephila pilipes TaxID=299642 RepID=A0A8X6JZI4_NEPPI|nr:hypothetical protein NPIL_46841 [Nephila pilipes]
MRRYDRLPQHLLAKKGSKEQVEGQRLFDAENVVHHKFVAQGIYGGPNRCFEVNPIGGGKANQIEGMGQPNQPRH